MSIYNFWDFELDTESAKRIEQKHLDGSAFAIVFLQTKHDGETVLYMQLWTHDISFNIDLWLVKLWTKNVYSLVENWLNYLNQTYLVCSGPICNKSHMTLGRFDQNINFFNLQLFYELKTKVILMNLQTFFFMWDNQIFKILSGSWVIPKHFWKKGKKNGFSKNAMISKPNIIFSLKLDTPTIVYRCGSNQRS